ncbi:N-acetylmuramoyl-L-alanine amidase [Caloranaerobacter azorensis]|uniref:N-acetylmuramoyl-L-alanine amidase n=1 Tax=Caloranaerobacter azorensis TaxID=116090 RepID=A0A6P1YEQ9_9FIRM|nr:N-acetylmuramoyl-L-alanine amidase [Caloranaerobacter azorensis]QIB27760.1 N-acetylmuramoyl-L-alanine amidase [Caloranaerobacter azorensis]
MIDDRFIYLKIYSRDKKRIIIKRLEEIVKYITATQIPDSIENVHPEFIKVQVILARTNLIRKMRMFGGEGCLKYSECDICDEGHCITILYEDELKEKWGSRYNSIMRAIEDSIKATEGLIITMNNKPIMAKFHNTCGGATENSENVIGNRVMYLRKVLCDYCLNSPNWEGYKEISIEEIEEKLKVKFPNLTPTLRIDMKGFIEEIDRDEEGRIKSIKIGGKMFKGTEIKEILKLDSTRFSIVPKILGVKTCGQGDGLGLCQHGANQMALIGFKFNDIINYYFTGVEIKEIEKPCIKWPLKEKILVIDPGHGGDDNVGVKGHQGLMEKDVVLKISKRLKEFLEKLGAVVYLTRDDDEYVSLNRRAELANKIRPNFFISIHLNSFYNPSIRGCEMYYYKGDIESKRLAECIMDRMVKNINVVNKGIKVAAFFLLREVGASSLHIDIDYITNPEVEKLLQNSEYIDKISESITQGIVEYYKF